MDWNQIKAAIKIAQKLQYFLMATADKQGVPHVTTAGEIALKSPGILEISFWFCPKTIDNLQQNKKISLIIWDAKENSGYQLIGTAGDVNVLKDQDRDVLENEEGKDFPQSYLSLTVRVDTVMEFIHALHSDLPL